MRLPRGGGCAARRHVTLSPQSEHKLILRAKHGDMDAFGTLVRRNQEAVTRTVAAMLGNSADVDDVVQEVFIRFYGALHRFRGDAAAGTYLHRVAITQSLDALRRHKRDQARFTRMDTPDAIHAQKQMATTQVDFDRAEQVNRAIQELRPHHRSVVVLRLVEGYSTREAAAILKIPVGTVLSRLSRATAALRESLRHLRDDGA